MPCFHYYYYCPPTIEDVSTKILKRSLNVYPPTLTIFMLIFCTNTILICFIVATVSIVATQTTSSHPSWSRIVLNRMYRIIYRRNRNMAQPSGALNPVNVLIVGTTGSGKSTLANLLLYGEDAPAAGFAVGDQGDSMTTHCASATRIGTCDLQVSLSYSSS